MPWQTHPTSMCGAESSVIWLPSSVPRYRRNREINMQKIIESIKLLLRLLAIWKPATKEQPRAKNDSPVGVDTPDRIIDEL